MKTEEELMEIEERAKRMEEYLLEEDDGQVGNAVEELVDGIAKLLDLLLAKKRGEK